MLHKSFKTVQRIFMYSSIHQARDSRSHDLSNLFCSRILVQRFEDSSSLFFRYTHSAKITFPLFLLLRVLRIDCYFLPPNCTIGVFPSLRNCRGQIPRVRTRRKIESLLRNSFIRTGMHFVCVSYEFRTHEIQVTPWSDRMQCWCNNSIDFYYMSDYDERTLCSFEP